MQHAKHEPLAPRHFDAMGRVLAAREEHRRLAVIAVMLMLALVAIIMAGVGFALRAQAMPLQVEQEPSREEVLAGLYGCSQPVKGETIARLGRAYSPLSDRPGAIPGPSSSDNLDEADTQVAESALTLMDATPEAVVDAVTSEVPLEPSAQEALQDAIADVVSDTDVEQVVILSEDDPEYFKFHPELGDVMLDEAGHVFLKADGTTKVWEGELVLHRNSGVIHILDDTIIGREVNENYVITRGISLSFDEETGLWEVDFYRIDEVRDELIPHPSDKNETGEGADGQLPEEFPPVERPLDNELTSEGETVPPEPTIVEIADGILEVPTVDNTGEPTPIEPTLDITSIDA